LAVLLSLVIISPNLIWQFTKVFPVVHHLKELADTQLVNVDRLDFLKSQLLFFVGGIFVILAGLIALLVYKPFRTYNIFFFSILFTLIAFLYFKAKNYYAIGIYPVYIAFGSVYIEKLLNEGWKKYLRPVAVLIPLILFIPIYQVAFPNKKPEYIFQNPENYRKFGMLKWEDGKEHLMPQDFADMLGWKELAEKVDSVFENLPNPDKTLILCDNYGQAGAINYYSSNSKITATSFNADYINWFQFDKEIMDVILVKENNDDDDKARTMERTVFDTVYLASQRINRFAREDTISIYLLLGAKVDINAMLKMEIHLKKSQISNGSGTVVD
jgi:hypothetical protein